MCSSSSWTVVQSCRNVIVTRVSFGLLAALALFSGRCESAYNNNIYNNNINRCCSLQGVKFDPVVTARQRVKAAQFMFWFLFLRVASSFFVDDEFSQKSNFIIGRIYKRDNNILCNAYHGSEENHELVVRFFFLN